MQRKLQPGSPALTRQSGRTLAVVALGCVLVLIATVLPTAAPAGAITGGTTAAPSLYQWMVTIKTANTHGTLGGCGAVLVSPTHVLTAAHCVTSDVASVESVMAPSKIDVYISRGGPRFSGPNPDVTDVTVHPSYLLSGFGGFNTDIAIITVETPQTGPFAPLGQLDQPVTSYTEPKPDLTFAGHGRTSSTSPGSSALKEGRGQLMPYLPDATKGWTRGCFNSTAINAKVLCVRNILQSLGRACLGDSGGPVLNKFHEVVGIMSQVVSVSTACDTGHMTIAVNVWTMRCFIDEATNGDAHWISNGLYPTKGLPLDASICSNREREGTTRLCDTHSWISSAMHNGRVQDGYEDELALYGQQARAYKAHERSWNHAYQWSLWKLSRTSMPTHLVTSAATYNANQQVGPVGAAPVEPENPLIDLVPCAWAIDPANGLGQTENSTGSGSGTNDGSSTNSQGPAGSWVDGKWVNGAGVTPLNAPSGGTTGTHAGTTDNTGTTGNTDNRYRWSGDHQVDGEGH